jgi:cobalt-zinc-cadmium efflux system protein
VQVGIGFGKLSPISHVHQHEHGPTAGDGDVAPGRLAAAAAINGGFGVAQVIGGLAIGSVAVLADAAHQAADAIGLLIALTAALLARRPPSAERTFGWGRADAIGAQISGSLLLASLAWLTYETVGRLIDPVAVEARGLSVFGILGIAVNGIGLLLLRGSHGHVLSVRAARIHLLTDLGGSMVVLLAGVGVALTGWDRLDPLASLVISAAAAWTTVDLLRSATGVLMDRVPAHLDMAEVTATLAAEPGVQGVHHLHLWSLGGGDVALSAHIQLAGDLALHEAQERTRGFEELLLDRFGIGHTTIQVECHDCEAPTH